MDFLAVTVVDSASKALEFLGLQESEQRINHHQVCFLFNFFNSLFFFRGFYFINRCLISHSLFVMPGNESRFNYHRLFNAWNDWL